MALHTNSRRGAPLQLKLWKEPRKLNGGSAGIRHLFSISTPATSVNFATMRWRNASSALVVAPIAAGTSS
ncbi:MAG: hypothetical protein M3463_14130 [Verrucomicrobiota bacterium]|nr:hypothetical protein [Verrucomicrobiota bacterium]